MYLDITSSLFVISLGELLHFDSCRGEKMKLGRRGAEQPRAGSRTEPRVLALGREEPPSKSLYLYTLYTMTSPRTRV